jgi:methylated-DNA-[protein]-cysteine S-methyltransferase
MRYHYTLLDTELGHLGLVRSAAGLVRVTIAQSRAAVLESINTDYPNAVESVGAFGDLQSRLVRYLDGERVAFNDGIDLSALTGFQRAVLEAARDIPYSEVRSYGCLAQQVGRPGAARAVGQALARNPVPIVVPCHRVIGGDGGLTGFSSGLEMKRRLLEIEGATIVEK